ncbi:MAG: YqgE/AlgH family protein [Gammaproteobacteria bacterium]|nr:YqgE/AlgH family protein [Gammaproteobacteria bacterium]
MESPHLDLTNHFLIAMPSMDDPNFSQSVTYICEHGAEGAMGIVINRPMEISLGDVLEQLDINHTGLPAEQQPVYAGGPVLEERGFILHRPRGEWESSLQVTPEISVTTSKDILAALGEGRGPADVIFALGYAGWSAGQLEQEMQDNAWLSAPASTDILFKTPPARRWLEAAKLIGIDPRLLSSNSGHA